MLTVQGRGAGFQLAFTWSGACIFTVYLRHELFVSEGECMGLFAEMDSVRGSLFRLS